MNELIGTIGIMWFLLGLAVVVLWLLLPFAVFGIKDRLDRLTEETKRTNKLLAELVNSANSTRGS
jgi:hypothetical protein